MDILIAKKTSNNQEGIVTMNIAIAVNKYNATPKSAFFTYVHLPFFILYFSIHVPANDIQMPTLLLLPDTFPAELLLPPLH